MQYIAEAMRLPAQQAYRPACQLMRLLVAWLHSCSAAVAAFLGVPQHLALAADLAAGRLGVEGPAAAGADVAGLGAVLLGTTLLFAPETSHAAQQQQPGGVVSASPGRPGAQVVLDVLLHRVGLSQLFGRLEAMRQGPAWQAAAAQVLVPNLGTAANGSALSTGAGAMQHYNPFDAG